MCVIERSVATAVKADGLVSVRVSCTDDNGVRTCSRVSSLKTLTGKIIITSRNNIILYTLLKI